MESKTPPPETLLVACLWPSFGAAAEAVVETEPNDDPFSRCGLSHGSSRVVVVSSSSFRPPSCDSLETSFGRVLVFLGPPRPLRRF